jgi:hypothetical protein
MPVTENIIKNFRDGFYNHMIIGRCMYGSQVSRNLSEISLNLNPGAMKLLLSNTTYKIFDCSNSGSLILL